MAPAFGLVEAKGLLPYFMDSVTKGRKLRLCFDLQARRLILALTIRWQTSGAISSGTESLDVQPLSM